MQDELDVAFFAPWIGPLLTARPGASAGGAETQMLMVARGLAGRGLRVGLVVFAGDEPLPREAHGLRVIEVPEPRVSRPGVRQLERAVRVSALLLRLRARVLVQRIAGPETGLVALVARLRRRRFVYSSANVVDFSYEQLGTGRAKAWLYHMGVRLADEVVVQTPEQVALCERRFGRKPALVKSIADADPQKRAHVPEAFLWVGRTDWYKRAEAYIDLARALPEARFRMIAMPMDEAGRSRASELAREARSVENLEFLPPRPRAELAELIPSAVAMVNTADYEGMPNVFLEGWSRGIPALALSHDPDGVIVRERIGGFAEGSPERLAALASELWDGRLDREELGARCRAYVAREHSPEAVLDRWQEALELA